MSQGVHHYHLRQRDKAKSETDAVRLMDRIMFIIGPIEPIMAIPQLYNIWINHQAQGVSLISWFAYFIFALFWMIYGCVHKHKVLILVYSLNAIFNALIVIGILMYK